MCEPAEAPTCGVAQDGCALPIADVAVGESSSAELFFINISPGDVTLYLVDLSHDSCPALSVSDFEAVTLPPDAVACVEVTFAPTEPGPCAGVLEVYSDALNVDTGLPTSVTLEASGREP